VPLSIVTENITGRELTVKSLAERRKYKLINYKWDERVKSQFIDTATC
jgi:hypothetical protein